MIEAFVLVPAVAGVTAVAAGTDWRTRKVPNWLTLPAFLAALAFHGLTQGWAGLGFALAGFGVGFGLLLVLWLIGGGGAGDVKLMGALGAWLGAKAILAVLFLAALVIAVCWVAYAVWRIVGAFVSSRPRPVRSATSTRLLVPFAIPVAVAAWVVLAWMLLVERG